MAGKSGSKNTDEELSKPVVSAIAELADVDPASVAGLLDDRLDAAVSTRSSHDDPDPNGRISNLDAAVSTRSNHAATDVWADGQLHGPSDLKGGVDWGAKTPMVEVASGSSAYSDLVNVSGSGYILGWAAWSTDGGSVRFHVDGSILLDGLFSDISSGPSIDNWGSPVRFDDGFEVDIGSSSPGTVSARVIYVLD